MKLLIFDQLLLLSVLLLCFGCTKEDAASPTNRAVDIDPTFQPYLDTYIEEAAARGVSVPIEEKGLLLLFDDLEHLNGECRTFGRLLIDTTAEHQIFIDRDRWENLTDAYKEFLIFHEMGHCYEYRPHTTDTLPNGEWKSLMRDGTPPFGNSTLNFSGTRRDYYIDELFNENLTPPEWAAWSRDYDAIPEENKEVLAANEATLTFNRFLDLSGNYEIELSFTITADMTDDFIIVGWGNSTINNAFYFGFSDYNLIISDFITNHGRLHRRKKYDQFRIGDTPKLTVQKIDNYFWYFVNEECIYWSDVIDLETPRVLLSSSTIQADRISVKKLLN